MAKKTYQIKINPKKLEFLRNGEIYCFKCFENFGNLEALDQHKAYDPDMGEFCLPPRIAQLTPQKNFVGAVVWRITY